LSNSIGSLSFDNLIGNVDLPQMRREVENKSGDDGVSVFNTGRRGNAFELVGEYAFSTYDFARTAELVWRNTFTAAPQNLIMGGVDFAGDGITFIVLEVVSSEIKPMPFYQCPRGNVRVVVSPAFVLRCTFRLQPVEV
jgi:hypothetical protein